MFFVRFSYFGFYLPVRLFVFVVPTRVVILFPRSSVPLPRIARGKERYRQRNIPIITDKDPYKKNIATSVVRLPSIPSSCPRSQES